jgi:putative nucleotidyltransferase with HDIG domain
VGSLLAPQIADSFRGDPRLEAVVGSLRDRLLERMNADALELPLLPQVAMEVLALASSEDSDSRRLADLLRRDQAMTAHVLRVVNSPLYRSRVPIDSLTQAMSRLGLAKVRQIALIVSCRQRVFRVKGFEPEVYRAFRHSLATALFAQEVARARHSNEEDAFLAGLLHDVGRPVLLQAVVDVSTEPRLVDGPAVMAVIAELHTRVGNVLARKWALPHRVAEAIAYHHDPAACGASNPLPMIVALADDLAMMALDANDANTPSPVTHWTLSHLKLAPEGLATVVAQRAVLVQTLQAVA